MIYGESGAMSEWSKEPDSKSGNVFMAFKGSNPFHSVLNNPLFNKGLFFTQQIRIIIGL